MRRRSCPGRTDRKESSSGAPKKMAGMKSRKVCVIAIETMKITKTIGDKEVKKGSEREERRIAAMRLICIPGNRPVKVPARRPSAMARMIWSII